MGQRGSRYHMIGQGLSIQGLGGSTGVIIWGMVKSKCGKHRFVGYPVISEKVVGEPASQSVTCTYCNLLYLRA